MSNNPPTFGAVVSNTDPEHRPGPEPLIGQHVRLEHLTQKHFPDLYKNVGSHTDLWAWWPNGLFSTTSEFDDNMNELLQMTGDLMVYTVILLAGPNKGKAVGFAFSLSKDRLTNRLAELFYGPLL